MPRSVYVNGDFVPETEAKVSVFDRGFLFGDGVYEVSAVLEGCLIDNQAHMARLARSLGELKMSSPVPLDRIPDIQRELIARNDLKEGMVYLQITRGAADRDFNMPAEAAPTLIMFTQAYSILDDPADESGLSVVTLPDIRWRRRDIKTVMLLAASLAKQEASDQGADDAWLVEDGHVTEGTANNAFIVTRDSEIVTRALSQDILHGTTRKAILRLAEQEGLEIVERPFTPEEAYQAVEAFITSATNWATPVVKIDGRVIGDGRPGPVSRKLRDLYLEMARAELEASAEA